MRRFTRPDIARHGWCMLTATALFTASLGLRDRAAADDAASTTLSASSDKTSTDALKNPTSSTVRDERPGRPGRNWSPVFTPEREAAALTFVASHHPELTPLLKHLKTSRPNEYQKAIRKLFADSERLAHSREMLPRRYELELEEWKLESRAQLLVARLVMDRTAEREAELRELLAEQLRVRRQLLEIDRERTMQRAATIEKDIARLDADREKLLDERLQRALKSAGQWKQSLKGQKNGKVAK